MLSRTLAVRGYGSDSTEQLPSQYDGGAAYQLIGGQSNGSIKGALQAFGVRGFV